MKKNIIESEIYFLTQRSQGSGGQNVNRTNSAVTLQWFYKESLGLSLEQKEMIELKLSSRINEEGILYLRREIHRDQLKNKKDAISELYKILEKCFFKPKKRIATAPSRGAIKKRLKSKKIHSEKKNSRKNHQQVLS